MRANDNLISAQANVTEGNVKPRSGGRSQNQLIDWIITMMLVLFGLSTLKLR